MGAGWLGKKKIKQSFTLAWSWHKTKLPCWAENFFWIASKNRLVVFLVSSTECTLRPFTWDYVQFHSYLIALTSAANDIKSLIVHFLIFKHELHALKLDAFFSPKNFLLLRGLSCNYFDLPEYVIVLLFIYFYEQGKKFDLRDLYICGNL